MSSVGECSFFTSECLLAARRATGIFCASNVLLAQNKYPSRGNFGRYMSFPKAPEWMFSRPQSHEACHPIDKSWTQHYNPVDDVFYYKSPADKPDTDFDEIHVSNNSQMVKVRDCAGDLVRNSLPFCATGRIQSEFIPQAGSGRYIGIGTGVTIDTFVVLSVAHNFLPQALGGSKNIARYRAQRVSFEWRYDHPTMELSIPVTRYRIHPRWEQSFDPEFDIAVLLLDLPVKETSSHAKPLIIVPDDSIGKNITVVGYPARIPNVSSSLQGEIMYVSSGNILGCCGKQLHYNANTYNGNSGGPVVLDTSKSDLIGLHTRGDPTAMRNSGVKLRDELEEFICEALKSFYHPTSFEAEVKALITKKYPDLLIGQEEQSVISSLHTIEQVRQFLDFLNRQREHVK